MPYSMKCRFPPLHFILRLYWHRQQYLVYAQKTFIDRIPNHGAISTYLQSTKVRKCMKSFIQGLVLLFASALSLNASVISGIVTNTAGDTTLAGITIVLKKTTTGTATVARDTTDADGAYSVTWDTVGIYVVRTTDVTSKHVTQYDTVIITDASADITLNIKMSSALLSSVAGTVTDSSDDAALSGAIVTLRAGTGTGGTTQRDTADADGAYSFDNVTTGTYTVSASAAGYTAKSSSVTLGATAQTVDFKLVAVQISSIEGVVTDSSDDAVLAGAIVTLRTGTGTGGTTQRDTTDADGAYSFDSVTTGTYTVSVSATGYTAKSSAVTLDTAVQTVDFELVAVIYCSVKGTITDSATGAALSGATVYLRSNGQTLDSMVTDSTGAYTFDSAITGSYVKVEMTGYTTKRDTLTVTDSAAQTVDIKLAAVPINTIVFSAQNGLSTHQAVNITVNKALCLNNFNGAGVVFLYSANGRLIWKQTFCASSAALMLPMEHRLAGGGYVIRITQKTGIFTGRIVLP
jgi:hypothetical protein